MAFDLETTLQDAIEAAATPDVATLAADLDRQIPDDQLRAVVRETLPFYVRYQLSLYRTAMLRRHRAAAKERDKPSKSPKWAKVAEATHGRWWHVSVPKRGNRTEPKWLGECTVEEVRAVAAAYGSRASQQASYEKRYNRLADAMVQHEAKLVKDLPEQVVEDVFA